MLYNLLTPLADQIQFFNLFKYITVRCGGALATALFVSLLVGPALIRHFARIQHHYKTVRDDLPARHAETKTGTPTMGGVLILGTLLLSTLLWADMTNLYVLLTLCVVAAFGLIGFVDDWLKITLKRRGGLPGRVRLGAEAVVAILALYGVSLVLGTAALYTLFIPFFKTLALPLGVWGFLAFGSLVIVGSANAVNLTDGLDGLATVPAMIAAGSFALIAYIVGRVDFSAYLLVQYVPGVGELAVFCAALVGSCLGFLWFNAPPARIFMGDTGSLAMGAALGMVAVLTKHELVLAIIGGIFVLETVSVMVQVTSFKLTGRRVFRMAPLHHHFEQKGWAESTIVIRFWIISLILALVGLASFKLR
ncbi:MAG: phospho-N-acetylmuramoyl-pentapeptide-transferase [Proteobacteria bacterium]|nr:phospho-N-acetylmuramoyl-pentapeptide-transferase [Pseudomonadota bacterium]